MNLFSLSHIIYLIICTSICMGFYFIFKNKSKKTQNIALISILFLSFIIHFLKLLIPVYKNDLPNSIISITPETLCALSTLSFPFIYLSKSKSLKDYMLVIGIISGILTLLLPTEIIKYDPLNIETIRFFFSHLVLFLVPFFMYKFDIYKPTKKWIKHTLLLLLLAAFIITFNNIIFTFIFDGYEAGMKVFSEITGINKK